MPDVKSKSEVQRLIEQVIRPFAKDALAKFVAFEPVMTEAIRQLAAAIKQEEAAQARLYAAAMRQHLAKAQDVVADIDNVSKSIDAISNLADFAVEAKVVAAIVAKLEPAKKKLVWWLKLGNSLIGQADRLDKAARVADKRNFVEWAQLVSAVRKEFFAAERRLQSLKDSADEARTAEAGRSRQYLALIQQEAQREAAAVREPFAEWTRKFVLSFLKDRDPGSFSAEFAEQVGRDRRDLEALARRATELEAEAVKLFTRIMRTKIDPPDAERAAKVLGLDRGQVAALKKAFDLESEASIVKALDAIAKDAGLKTKGKDMLAKLRRERIL